MSNLASKLYEFGEFRLDPQSRVLRRAGTPVPLTPKAFDVLLQLVQNGGRVVTKDELMKAVWPDSFVEESNLTQTIFMVRKALEETIDLESGSLRNLAGRLLGRWQKRPGCRIAAESVLRAFQRGRPDQGRPDV